MRLYDGTIQEFKRDVLNNEIADIIARNFVEKIKRKVNDSEFRSWETSLRVLKDSLDVPELFNNKIVIEYRLPYSERRIDVILFGRSKERKDTVIVIELKQWSNNSLKKIDIEGNIEINYGDHWGQQAHPCAQVQAYIIDMNDYIKIFREKTHVDLVGCSYCHNYNKKEDSILYDEQFKGLIKEYPLFSKQDVKKLGEYLKEKLSSDPGFQIFNRFIHSEVGPSKMLMEHVGDMINKQQVFNLIDDQIAARNVIIDRAKKQARLHDKSVIIVKGGPGTGKSVIALEVMGEIMRSGKPVFHATGSSAFTNTLRKMVGGRARKFYKFFFNFTQMKENEIGVLICDEAHRIRKDSSDWKVPAMFKSTNPQIEDLIRPAKLSVFFIDEYQVVRPNEIGSVDLIKKSAEKLGVPKSNIYEFELKTQFRCSGSDSFLQWIEDVLCIRESEMPLSLNASGMEFKIVDSPHTLKKIIDEKNKEKPNSARIVAGFCWPWSNPKPDGTLVNDVKIGDFEMPWENKREYWKWAMDESGMNQVGTVYTSQGFEFEYIGIIFGKDLAYWKEKETWVAKPSYSHDSAAIKGNAQLIKHLKNVYRVLFSRAHKGVYVYFMDKETEDYFKSKMDNKGV
ncbi:MAG: DUF2075 domain-containing protein [Nanoarchaeota archaeon]